MVRLRIGGAVAALLATALLQPSSLPDGSSKFDRALRDWLHHPTASARVLIRAEHGSGDSVRQHLARVGSIVHDSPARADLIVAEVSAPALRSMARDPRVVRLSTDAVV